MEQFCGSIWIYEKRFRNIKEFPYEAEPRDDMPESERVRIPRDEM